MWRRCVWKSKRFFTRNSKKI